MAMVVDIPSVGEVEVNPIDCEMPPGAQIVTSENKWLTLSDMMNAYNTAWYGNARPTLILMSVSRFVELASKIKPPIVNSGRREGFSIRFMDGDCTVGLQTPSDEVWFINETYVQPDNPDGRVNSILRLGVTNG